MDEIKNPEAEEQKVENAAVSPNENHDAPTAEPAVETPLAAPAETVDTEEAPASAAASPAETEPAAKTGDEPVSNEAATAAGESRPEPNEAEAENHEAADAQAEEPKQENHEAQPHPTDKAGIISRLKEIAASGGEVERTELEHLKMLYYRFRNAEVVAARERFVADGGKAEDFMPAPDSEEEVFKAEMAHIRDLRSKAAEEMEQKKQANLERKREIIEKIKQMAASPEEADKSYDELKAMQAEWKELNPVPAESATELWKNYQLYVEQFYDQLRLNHEMRAYDFKKNLETKTHLCEAAEKLATLDDVVSAFHQLQNLHQQYRETGPVAKEDREQIWKRFKDASTVVNKRHQSHFEALKQQEEDNLQKKTDLCLQVEAMQFENLKTYAQWDDMAQQIIALQAQWKTIGFTPRKVNNEIYERFRMACDRFFSAKTAFFKQMREQLNANYEAKMKLIAEAESLKESTEWAATTARLVELQKQWKTVGPVARKVSDAIWKRFNEACNSFFDRKNEATSGERKEQEANLEKKNEVLAELAKIAETPAADQLQAVRDLQARWNEIGHVPFRKKEKMYKRYRELCDKIYDALHVEGYRRKLDSFRRDTADKGGSELGRELTRLQNAYEAKKQEIQNYETNLGFLTSKSKGTNPLVAEVEKKVARLKTDLQLLADKVKAVREQLKAEDKQ